MSSFDLESALLIQREQLDEWRTKLNSDCYLALEMEAQRRNALLPSETLDGKWPPSDHGQYVWRGTDMDEFIGNWRPKPKDGPTCHSITFKSGQFVVAAYNLSVVNGDIIFLRDLHGDQFMYLNISDVSEIRLYMP